MDELIGYLQARQEYIAIDHECRRAQQDSGSGPGETGNDHSVACGQKGQGRHWAQDMSAACTALCTLPLTRGRVVYWQHRQVLPLVAVAA